MSVTEQLQAVQEERKRHKLERAKAMDAIVDTLLESANLRYLAKTVLDTATPADGGKVLVGAEELMALAREVGEW